MGADLLDPRKGHRPSIKHGRRLCKVRPETVRVQSSRKERAIKEVDCVVLCHLSQRADRGRIIGRVEFGEGRRKGMEICQPGVVQVVSGSL